MDWVFVRGAVTVKDAEVIDDSRDGRFPSDHYFVSAKIVEKHQTKTEQNTGFLEKILTEFVNSLSGESSAQKKFHPLMRTLNTANCGVRSYKILTSFSVSN